VDQTTHELVVLLMAEVPEGHTVVEVTVTPDSPYHGRLWRADVGELVDVTMGVG